MQVETFKVYCDLIETASFSHAAKLNGITQSAVSQQVRALEKRFGVVLVERGKKNFAVTPEGQVFEEAAREMIEVFSGIEERLKELQDVVSGRLRIATIFSVGLHELPDMVSAFRKRYPEVDVKIEGNELVVEPNGSGDSRSSSAFHGMTRALIQNMVQGVNEGYSKTLEIVGVGWNAAAQGKKLTLNIGFCHPVVFDLPAPDESAIGP